MMHEPSYFLPVNVSATYLPSRLERHAPLEVLRQEPSVEALDRLSRLARHAGEMGA